MNKRILIADSSCELNDELTAQLQAKSVPLTMTIGEDVYRDDETLDMPAFLERLSHLRTEAKSACPAPQEFFNYCQAGADNCFITLSSKLSGSFQSAALAAQMAEEEEISAHAFDSKSASAGETLVAMQIAELSQQGMPFAELIERTEAFIDRMQTFFCLEHLDVFIHNGRINKIIGRLAGVLNIRPILGSDGEGGIAQYEKARGEAQSVEKLAATVESHVTAPEEKTFIIAYCACREKAEQLAEKVRAKVPFKRTILQETRGLSSLYANSGGVIVAF